MSNLPRISKKWPKRFWTEVTVKQFIRAWKAYQELFNDPIERFDEGRKTGPQVTFFNNVPLFRVTYMCNNKKDGYYINSEHIGYMLELAEELLKPVKAESSEVVDFETFYKVRYE